jgi:hypothetical protein
MHGAVCVSSRNTLVQLAAILFIVARRDYIVSTLGSHTRRLSDYYCTTLECRSDVCRQYPLSFSTPLSSSRVLLAGSMPGAYFYGQVASLPITNTHFKTLSFNPFQVFFCSARAKQTLLGGAFLRRLR